MKKVLRAYKKTVSIVNETAIWMYENLGSDRIGFLMESNEKESGKYTFMGVDPQALVQSEKDGLVITENNGNVTKLKGKGFLNTEVRGNYSYITSIISEEEYREEQMRKMKDFWHDGSIKEMFQTLITPEEKEELQDLIDDLD